MTGEPEPQRIARLTPVEDVLARIAAHVVPVDPCDMELAAAVGRTLAEDIVARDNCPAIARALRDGFAVQADMLADASAYSPAPLAFPPVRVNVGDVLPAGVDAVALLDAIVTRGGRWEAIAPVAPGEGVLVGGGDLTAGEPVHRAGERLRAAGAAVLTAAGRARAKVRVPRIALVQPRPGDVVLDAARDFLARGIARHGGVVDADPTASPAAGSVADGLTSALDGDADAVISIGGTGAGSNDASVRTLARYGRVDVHGVALQPGETAAFGFTGTRPVLLVPGRLDAALAVWLVLGSRIVGRLAGTAGTRSATKAVLSRKVASPLGLMDIVPVSVRDGRAEPLASGYWPLRALAQADGWIAIAADSEGHPAGAEVMVRRLP